MKPNFFLMQKTDPPKEHLSQVSNRPLCGTWIPIFSSRKSHSFAFSRSFSNSFVLLSDFFSDGGRTSGLFFLPEVGVLREKRSSFSCSCSFISRSSIF